MYLKALEIQGFKSFPDKTVLNFGEDITAIVGPNGSGKSNISDAIRWVMGEQNSRQLRGAKMEDVIFGGTEKRSQMGFAQVTLVIDNTEHIFPTRDEAEVAVTRRYYRSGESEYYINRQSVRLKDVNELFMDTGMGREGYSIIGQGKIDEILSVKSGERREVFEEAAGISKYRHRKEESERKLERTQENLVRINDKIAELELQVEPLRRQAETAKKYLVLRDELRVLEISVWLENLQALKTGALKLRTDFEAAQADKNRAQDALDAVYAAAEDCAEQMRACDVRAEGLRSEMGALESQAAEQESEIAVLRTGVAHNEESLERLAREMEDSQGRADGLQSQMDALERRAAEIERQTQQMQTELDGWLAGAQELAQQAGSAAQEAEALRAKEALSASAAADARAELLRAAGGHGRGARAPHGHRAGARCGGGKAGAGAARSEGEPPCPARGAGGRAGRREYHSGAQPAHGGPQAPRRRDTAGETAADNGAQDADRSDRPARRDGEGVRGLFPRGEARDARRRKGRAARDPRPGGEPDGDGSGLYRRAGDCARRRAAEYRRRERKRREERYRALKAARRRPRDVPPGEHRARKCPARAGAGAGDGLCRHREPPCAL